MTRRGAPSSPCKLRIREDLDAHNCNAHEEVLPSMVLMVVPRSSQCQGRNCLHRIRQQQYLLGRWQCRRFLRPRRDVEVGRYMYAFLNHWGCPYVIVHAVPLQ